MKRNPSIRQVASLAGVSVATISRVINGKGPVRDATRSRVLAAIESTGYVPHSAARSLSTRRTMSFGILLPEVHGEFFSELIRGIDLAARRSGYHILVSSSHSDPAEAQAVLHALHGRVDGLIVMTPGNSKVSPPTRFPLGVPVVELSSGSPSRLNDSIRIDNRGGARAATEHLLGLGHRRIAMICGPAENSEAHDRQLGFTEALADQNVALDPALLLPGDFRELSGFKAGAAIAELRHRPTAVFAANDAMAVGCLAALRDSGLRIPEDVALAGFDDIPIARFLTPGLTSVRVAIAELGARAAERLLTAIEGGSTSPRHHEVVSATLVVRGSTSNPTNPVRGNDSQGGSNMSKSMLWKRLVCLLLLAFALAWVNGPVYAQDTTASIRGVVKDPNGPLPAATVVAIDAASGFRHSATTGPDGSFALPGLRPGTYEIKISSEAYSEQSRTVTVLLGQDVEADFVLSPSEVVVEGMTVIGEATQVLLDTDSSEISTNITSQQIERLPQSSRNFLSFAALAPGVRFSDNQDEAGQKFRSGGADARQVNVFVDGLSYKNDLLQGGAFMQDSSRGNPFPQSAVQEYRVLTQNYKAEYEKAAAAVITAVTKSGGNAFHGDLFYMFQDKSLVTQDDFAKARGEKEAEYKRDQYGLSLGGPIIQDKLHFFVTYEGNDQDRVSSIFRGSEFAHAPANVQDALDGYQTGTVTAPFESKLFFAKLSWQPASAQTFEASYHVRDESEVRGFGGQRTLDGAESFEVGTNALVVRHTWVLGNSLNEAAATMQQLQWNPTAVSSTTPRLNYFGILDVGGKDGTQNFIQDKIGLRDDFTFMTSWLGEHTMKTGLSVNWLDYEITKELFANGVFEFRSDERWQFPFQARLGFGNPSLKFSNTQLGLYFQDDWEVLPNLTLNLGLRWDYETNMLNNDFVTPPNVVSALEGACRTYSQPVGGRTTWCLRDFLDLNRYTTDGNDREAYTGMFQPRIGFSWDVAGNAKTVVFGGWGVYYDRIILNDIYDEAYRQQYSIFSFCFSADGTPTPGCGGPAIAWRPEYQSAEGLAGLIASGRAPGPEIWLVPNDMKPPRSTQYTLGVRQQFGRWLTALSYVGVEGHNSQMQFFGDNPPGTAFNDRFGGNVSVPGYGRIFVASTVGRTWYDGVYLTIDKPYSDNWGLNLAYTYAKASKNGVDNPGEGLQFGAFDYGTAADLYKFPGSNDERHRIVLSGMVGLPWSFRVSSLLTVGSGVPFTIFDGSGPQFRVRWNEGRSKESWPYQSLDTRLDWEAPPIAERVTFGLSAEVFNLTDHDNFGCYDNFKPAPPTVSTVGKPNCEFSTRRFQIGARVRF